MRDLDVGGLRRLNAGLALVHAIQGVLMLVLSTTFALPVTTAFLRFDPVSQRLAPNLETAFELPIGPAVAAFLFLSALAHGVTAAPGVYAWYARHIAARINYARWIEYALSASLMMVVIAMLVGIYDAVALLAIFGCNAGMIFFGWVMERHNQTTQRTDWTAFWLGCVIGAVPWVGVSIYLFGSGGDGGGPPAFVYAIYGSIFVFFNLFAINMWLQYRRVGRWRDYVFGERAYMWLSLIAKSLLAWQVFAGTLRPV